MNTSRINKEEIRRDIYADQCRKTSLEVMSSQVVGENFSIKEQLYQ